MKEIETKLSSEPVEPIKKEGEVETKLSIKPVKPIKKKNPYDKR